MPCNVSSSQIGSLLNSLKKAVRCLIPTTAMTITNKEWLLQSKSIQERSITLHWLSIVAWIRSKSLEILIQIFSYCLGAKKTKFSAWWYLSTITVSGETLPMDTTTGLSLCFWALLLVFLRQRTDLNGLKLAHRYSKRFLLALRLISLDL